MTVSASTCPICGAAPDNFDGLGMNDAETVYNNVTCNSCGADLCQVYTLTKVELVDEEGYIIKNYP